MILDKTARVGARVSGVGWIEQRVADNLTFSPRDVICTFINTIICIYSLLPFFLIERPE